MPTEPLPLAISAVFLLGMFLFVVLTFTIGREAAQYWTSLICSLTLCAVLGISWLIRKVSHD